MWRSHKRIKIGSFPINIYGDNQEKGICIGTLWYLVKLPKNVKAKYIASLHRIARLIFQRGERYEIVNSVPADFGFTQSIVLYRNKWMDSVEPWEVSNSPQLDMGRGSYIARGVVT